LSETLQDPHRILVAGASGQVGDYLTARLAALAANSGCAVVALSRVARDNAPPWLDWRQADLETDLPPDLRADSLIHLAPLWLLPRRLPQFAASGVKRIVALSSTSVFTKNLSPDAAERHTADLLAEAESALEAGSARYGTAWTVLRPTLIYGRGREQNISAIATFIRRHGFFPLPGAACGLRAPVHADDVAQACIAALLSGAAKNRAYQLCGGDTVTYREMVERIFLALGRKPRVMRLPEWSMLALAQAAAWAGAPGISVDLVRRMNRDQVFDHGDAMRDLGYSPRGFRPQFQ
jgi:nucleoside-diphosphate-sugar epimerase